MTLSESDFRRCARVGPREAELVAARRGLAWLDDKIEAPPCGVKATALVRDGSSAGLRAVAPELCDGENAACGIFVSTLSHATAACARARLEAVVRELATVSISQVVMSQLTGAICAHNMCLFYIFVVIKWVLFGCFLQ